MEGVFHFKHWFLDAPGLIHGGAYYRNITVSHNSVIIATRFNNDPPPPTYRIFMASLPTYQKTYILLCTISLGNSVAVKKP